MEWTVCLDGVFEARFLYELHHPPTFISGKEDITWGSECRDHSYTQTVNLLAFLHRFSLDENWEGFQLTCNGSYFHLTEGRGLCPERSYFSFVIATL